MAGIRADRIFAENNPSPTYRDGDEASQVPPVSPRGHPGACLGNHFSGSAYLSPPLSQGGGSPTVMNSADISRSASARRVPATAGFGTQPADLSRDRAQLNFMDPRNESLVQVMKAYREKEYDKLRLREKVLENQQDLDQQKTVELDKRMSTLKNAIEKIETKGAGLTMELANDLTLDERRAMEGDLDVPKAWRRKELESVVAERTQLLQRISGQAQELVTVRNEQATFARNAKAHMKDVLAVRDGADDVLAFLNGLPAGRTSA